MRRLIVKTAAGIVAVVAIACLGLYGYLRRSLPGLDGTVTIEGPSAPIEIVRDADAIPHIFAANKPDALFGLGYVHAQDRLWQMEFQRRIGHGRLSEIFGAATIPQDRFLRTVGFGRAARTMWAGMSDWAKDQVNAYTAGVNAFIATHHGGALPPEFSLLRFEPEPWTGADVTVWVKMMAWDLSANYSFELLRDDIASAVGTERMAQLMPDYPVDGLSIVSNGVASSPSSSSIFPSLPPSSTLSEAAVRPSGTATSWTQALIRGLSAGDSAVSDFLLGGARAEGRGSNNWVVDGTLSATGRPMLANDPHLSARLPSTWYLAHLSAGDFDVIGATLPGTPAVAIGRNKYIAWGETNVAADVEDLYRERLDPTGRFAEYRGTEEPITIVPETIAVKGGPPILLDVRVTRHGPLVTDALNANNAGQPAGVRAPMREPLAFRWTALDPGDTTLQSFLRLNEARNWSQFVTALSDFVVPSQNFVYADVDGHIGYYAPGRIPIRSHGDGSRPTDGWTGEAEWAGWVPFDELPHLFDPPDHFIVTANHRPAPPGYRYLLGLEWVEPYRAARIIQLLERQPKLTIDDFSRIQADTHSLHAAALLPILLAHARPEHELDRQAVTVLRAWNLDSTADSAAAAIFNAWFLELAPILAGDELGPQVTQTYGGKFSYVTRFVVNTLTSNARAWCADGPTGKGKTCEDAVTEALHTGIQDLTRRLGADINRWRWDRVHRAVFPHSGLDSVAALRPLLSRSVPNGGDWSTVNVGPVAVEAAFEQHSVAGFRQIIDLSPANDSRFLDAVGESGHPLSTHYDDFLDDWRAVRHRKMRMSREEIERGSTGHLRLIPR